MPELIGGAEWADTYRVLGVDESANRSGRWKTEAWQAGILEAFADPRLDWVVVLKAAQMGVSELVRCAIGRWACLDPGDTLWVMSTEAAARRSMKKLQAMFRSTPCLRGLISPRRRDTSLLEMVLSSGMKIVIGWSGSASSLASDPFRRVILDETGLYADRVGKEGNPVRLAEERIKTYGRRGKMILLSKPSHADDMICSHFDDCLDRQEFHVPCAACGELQALQWGAVRWPGGDPERAPSSSEDRVRLAAAIEIDQSAWIECRGCQQSIGSIPDAIQSAAAIWAQPEPDDTKTRRRAYHISELYHWARSVSDLVARFLRCVKPADKQDFHTGSLGRPYVAERSHVVAGLFAARAIWPACQIPSWATSVIATADTQKDHFWFMIRAWGKDSRSRLVDWGRVETFDELGERCLRTDFPLEGVEGHFARPQILLIDGAGGTAGGLLEHSRTRDVYLWAAKTQGVIPLKGDIGRGRNHFTIIEHKTLGIRIARPDSSWFKSALMKLIRSTDPILWEESDGAESAEYGRQMTGQKEEGIEDAGGRKKWRWTKRRGRPDHLFDCAAYQVVAHDEIVKSERDEPIAATVRRRSAAAPQRRREPARGWVDGSGWWE